MTDTAGSNDPQDVAEGLDPEVLPEYDDPAGNLRYPAERPVGVNEYGLTAAEERVDEPLAERVEREVDDPATDVRARGNAAGERPVGRLVAPGDDDSVLFDVEAEAVAHSVREPDLSAEEAAVHLVEPTRDDD
jgi:hypothetical protein